MAGKVYEIPYFGKVDEAELQGLQILLYELGYEDVLPTAQPDKETLAAIKDASKNINLVKEIWKAQFPDRTFPQDLPKELSRSETVKNWWGSLTPFEKIWTILGDWGKYGRDFAVGLKMAMDAINKDPETQEKVQKIYIKFLRGEKVSPEDQKFIDEHVYNQARHFVASGEATRKMNPIHKELFLGVASDLPFDVAEFAVSYITNGKVKSLRPIFYAWLGLKRGAINLGSRIVGKVMETGNELWHKMADLFSRPTTARAIDLGVELNKELRNQFKHIKGLLGEPFNEVMENIVYPRSRRLVESWKVTKEAVSQIRRRAEVKVLKLFEGLTDDEIMWIDGALTDPKAAGQAPTVQALNKLQEIRKELDILGKNLPEAIKREHYAPQPIIRSATDNFSERITLMKFKDTPFYLHRKTLGTYSRSKEEVLARFAYRYSLPEITKLENEFNQIVKTATNDMLKEALDGVEGKVLRQNQDRFISAMERLEVPERVQKSLLGMLNDKVIKPITSSWRTAVLSRPGYFVRNAYSAVERVLTEFISDVSHGKRFSPIFFKAAPDDVLGLGLYGIQKPQTNRVSAWLYEHLGQNVEDFFRSGIYWGKYSQILDDLKTGNFAAESKIVERLAKVFSIDPNEWKYIASELDELIDWGKVPNMSVDDFNEMVEQATEYVLNMHYVPSKFAEYLKFFSKYKGVQVDFGKLAHDLSADEVDRVMCNYRDFINLQTELRGVAPFLQWIKHNAGYWLETWAKVPWLLSVQVDQMQERQDISLKAFGDIFGVDEHQVVFSNLLTTADLLRPFVPYEPKWIKEHKMVLEKDYQQWLKIKAQDIAKAEKFVAQRPELREYIRVQEFNALRKASSFVGELLRLAPTASIPAQLLGLVEKQDWRSLTPYADVIMRTTGIDIEFFLGKEAHEAKVKSWENDIRREMRLMAIEGASPTREAAIERVRAKAISEAIWGHALGLYGRSVTEKEIKMQGMLNSAFVETKLRVEPAEEDVQLLKAQYGLSDAQAWAVARRKVYPKKSLFESKFYEAAKTKYPELDIIFEAGSGNSEIDQANKELDQKLEKRQRLLIANPAQAAAFVASEPMLRAYLNTKSYRDDWDELDDQTKNQIVTQDSGYEKYADALAKHIKSVNSKHNDYSARVWADRIILTATTRGLDPAYLAAVIERESNFDMNPSRSSLWKGEVGAMQLRPVAIEAVRQLTGRKYNPNVLEDNLEAGAIYLAHQLNGKAQGDMHKAYAFYNGGTNGDQNPTALKNADAVMNILGSIKSALPETKLAVKPGEIKVAKPGEKPMPTTLSVTMTKPGTMVQQMAAGAPSIQNIVVTAAQQAKSQISTGEYAKEDVVALRNLLATLGYDVSTSGDPGIIDAKFQSVINTISQSGFPQAVPWEIAKTTDESLIKATIDERVTIAKDWLWENGWSLGNLSQLSEKVYVALVNDEDVGKLIENAELRESMLYIQNRFKVEGQKAPIYREILRRAVDPNDPERNMYEIIVKALGTYPSHRIYLTNPAAIQRLAENEENAVKDKIVRQIINVALGYDRWTAPMLESVVKEYGWPTVERAASVNGKLKKALLDYNRFVEVDGKSYRLIYLVDKYDATVEHYHQSLTEENRRVNNTTISQIFKEMKDKDPLLYEFFFTKYEGEYWFLRKLFEEGKLEPYEEQIRAKQYDSKLRQYFTFYGGYTTQAFDAAIKDLGRDVVELVAKTDTLLRLQLAHYDDPTPSGMRTKEQKDKVRQRALELAEEINTWGLSKSLWSQIQEEPDPIKEELMYVSKTYREFMKLEKQNLLDLYFKWGDTAESMRVKLTTYESWGMDQWEIINKYTEELSEDDKVELLTFFMQTYPKQAGIIYEYQSGNLKPRQIREKTYQNVKGYLQRRGWRTTAFDELLKPGGALTDPEVLDAWLKDGEFMDHYIWYKDGTKAKAEINERLRTMAREFLRDWQQDKIPAGELIDRANALEAQYPGVLTLIRENSEFNDLYKMGKEYVRLDKTYSEVAGKLNLDLARPELDYGPNFIAKRTATINAALAGYTDEQKQEFTTYFKLKYPNRAQLMRGYERGALEEQEILEDTRDRVIGHLERNEWSVRAFQTLQEGIFKENPKVLDAWLNNDDKFKFFWGKYETGELARDEANKAMQEEVKRLVTSIRLDGISPQTFDELSVLEEKYPNITNQLRLESGEFNLVYTLGGREYARLHQLYEKQADDWLAQFESYSRLDADPTGHARLVERGESIFTPFEQASKDPAFYQYLKLRFSSKGRLNSLFKSFESDDYRLLEAQGIVQATFRQLGRFTEQAREAFLADPKKEAALKLVAPFDWELADWAKKTPEQIREEEAQKKLTEEVKGAYNQAKVKGFPSATLREWEKWKETDIERYEELITKYPDVEVKIGDYLRDREYYEAKEDPEIQKLAGAAYVWWTNRKLPGSYDIQPKSKILQYMLDVDPTGRLAKIVMHDYANTPLGYELSEYIRDPNAIKEDEELLEAMKEYGRKYDLSNWDPDVLASTPPEWVQKFIAANWDKFIQEWGRLDIAKRAKMEEKAKPYIRQLSSLASRGELTGNDLRKLPQDVYDYLYNYNGDFYNWVELDKLDELALSQAEKRLQPLMVRASFLIDRNGLSPEVMRWIEEQDPLLGEVLARLRQSFATEWIYWKEDKDQYIRFWHSGVAAKRNIDLYQASGRKDANFLIHPKITPEEAAYGVTEQDVIADIVTANPPYADVLIAGGVIPYRRVTKFDMDAAAFNYRTGFPLSGTHKVKETVPGKLELRYDLSYPTVPEQSITSPASLELRPTTMPPGPRYPLYAEGYQLALPPSPGIVTTYEPLISEEEMERIRKLQRLEKAQVALRLVGQVMEISQMEGPHFAQYMQVAGQAAEAGLLNFLPAAVSGFLMGPEFAILTTVVGLFESAERRRREEEARRRAEEEKRRQEMERRRALLMQAIEQGYDESFWLGLSPEQIKELSQGNERIVQRYYNRPTYTNRIGLVNALRNEFTRLNW